MTRGSSGDAGLLANVIAEQLKQKIQNQEYKAGDRLPVRGLCEEFNASETPVKQALNQLAATGLVVATPGCGMRVRSFDIRDMQNVLEARLMIEQFIARDAVARARSDRAWADRLRALLRDTSEAYLQCIEHHTRARFNRAHESDSALHAAIVFASPNPEIAGLYRTLNTHAGMFLGFERHTPETLAEVNAQHDAIVSALLCCDTDGLRAAFARHIETTMRIYRGASGAQA